LRNHTRTWSQFAALALMFLGALACTKDKKGAESGEKSGEVGEKTKGPKVFKYFRTSAHKTLDPMQQFDQASAEIITNVYDQLLEYHYLKRPYELVPGVLAKMPEKQKDNLTFVFTLKEGVVFHDDPAFPGGKGKELTVDDAIYSIKRFADANINNLSYILIKGFVKGLDEFRAETKKQGKKINYDKVDVTGIKKLGKYKFSVAFTSDNPLGLYPFAFSGMSMVAKEVVEKYGEDFPQHPVGTGPFYMKENSRRGVMKLARNSKYHQTYPDDGAPGDKEKGLLADAGKQLPLLDEVELPLIEESQPAMLKFKKGELDWIGMNKDDFDSMAYKDKAGNFHLKDEYAKKFLMYTEPNLYTGYLIFNLKDKLLGKNKALRQAISYAFSAQEWIDLMRNGRGVPLKTIVPPPIAGSQSDIEFEYYTKDLEMAKKKLAEAGYPGGKGLPEITMEFRSTVKSVRQDYEFMRAELAKIGIKLKGNFQTFSNYLKKVEDGNFQMTDSAWGADYPDAENFYQLLYGPNSAPGPNYSNFDNKRYNELFEKSRFMKNGPERYKLFAEMSAILKEEAPIVLRWTPLAFGMYQKWVKNLKRNMMIDAPYKFIGINPESRVSH
jgi:oligopeptide transport system substrate-binding protein